VGAEPEHLWVGRGEAQTQTKTLRGARSQTTHNYIGGNSKRVLGKGSRSKLKK